MVHGCFLSRGFWTRGHQERKRQMAKIYSHLQENAKAKGKIHVQWTFLNKPVCRPGFCALYGFSKAYIEEIVKFIKNAPTILVTTPPAHGNQVRLTLPPGFTGG